MKKTTNTTHKQNHEHFHDHFHSVTEYADQLEAPEREKTQKPNEVIAFLDIPPNATVADIGAGTGYFSFRMAQACPDATVVAIDVDPEILKQIAEKASSVGARIETVQSTNPSEDPLLHGRFDRILLVNVIHHIPERQAYMRNLRTLLKPNGQVLMIDITPEAEMGPPAEHRIPAAVIQTEMEDAHFTLVRQTDFLLPNQYCMLFSNYVA